MHTANIQTSDRCVKRRKLIDSGAIHLIGSFPLEATNTNSIVVAKWRWLIAYLCSRNCPTSVVERVQNPLVSPIHDWRRERSWQRYPYERENSPCLHLRDRSILPMHEFLRFEIGQGGRQLFAVENQRDWIEVGSIRHQVTSKLESIENQSLRNSSYVSVHLA